MDALFSLYSELAALLTLPERQSQEQELIVESVKTWLKHHTKWLLILDNADELDVISKFLPPVSSGHVLITTRAWDMQRLAQRIEVNALSIEQGALLLLRRAGQIPPDALLEQAPSKERILALQIAELIGGLPLALDQVGAYLEATGIPLEEYLQVYQKHRKSLLQQRGHEYQITLILLPRPGHSTSKGWNN
jgi:NB-ARC domain